MEGKCPEDSVVIIAEIEGKIYVTGSGASDLLVVLFFCDKVATDQSYLAPKAKRSHQKLLEA